jgi:coenzyme PQQ synthesis protein D (PqqD)
MGDEARLKRNGKLPFQEIDGQAVVLDPAKTESHELDEVGAFLWRELERSRTVAELVEAVMAEFEAEVGPDRVEKDVRAFVARLEEKGLVVRA